MSKRDEELLDRAFDLDDPVWDLWTDESRRRRATEQDLRQVHSRLRRERNRRRFAEMDITALSWIAFVAFVLVAALLGYIVLRGVL